MCVEGCRSTVIAVVSGYGMTIHQRIGMSLGSGAAKKLADEDITSMDTTSPIYWS
jgi:hypothetical protein